MINTPAPPGPDVATYCASPGLDLLRDEFSRAIRQQVYNLPGILVCILTCGTAALKHMLPLVTG